MQQGSLNNFDFRYSCLSKIVCNTNGMVDVGSLLLVLTSLVLVLNSSKVCRLED